MPDYQGATSGEAQKWKEGAKDDMKRWKKLLAAILTTAMLTGLIPGVGAYNALPTEATGNLGGVEMVQAVVEESMVLLENREVNG